MKTASEIRRCLEGLPLSIDTHALTDRQLLDILSNVLEDIKDRFGQSYQSIQRDSNCSFKDDAELYWWERLESYALNKGATYYDEDVTEESSDSTASKSIALTIEERREMLSDGDKERLKELHAAARFVLNMIDDHVRSGVSHKSALYESKLKSYKQLLTTLEFAMQRVWGFPEDANYHTWWFKAEECLCPKMDNIDPLYYGHGKIISSSCPIHGGCND